jgi:hypothetical protein
MRAEIELPPRLPLGLSEQPRRFTRIEPITVIGCRGLINVVCPCMVLLPALAL